uniref:Small VCP/p97-interacting protein n=1 Tax=Timema tahoe TaxID=61484 RepID=A0A7R9IPA8_9NEOP|nr:unnamed protein product [Timema tahoe]
MGICSSCFKNSSTDFVTPDMETRRQQQAAAAEKRLQEQDSRGIKNVDKVRRQQQRKEDGSDFMMTLLMSLSALKLNSTGFSGSRVLMLQSVMTPSSSRLQSHSHIYKPTDNRGDSVMGEW